MMMPSDAVLMPPDWLKMPVPLGLSGFGKGLFPIDSPFAQASVLTQRFAY